MSTEASNVLLSPRISALQRAVEAGDTTALDRFWDNITEAGAPLIEPLPDRTDMALVTILWRADEATTHVVFYSELLRGMWWNQWEDALLFHLPQTNLFYRTYRVRTDARFVYWIAPNLPLHHLNAVQDWENYLPHWQLDPLNPRMFVQDFNRSYVEMPAAPPQPWFQPRAGVPTGQVKQIPWHSTLLENDRDVWIYTPPGYQTHGDTLPLLLLFDGDIYTSWVPAPTICDNLIAAGHIPPLIMVMLNSPHREQELYCNDGFVSFLVHELYPWIHQTYRVTDDPRQTIVGGMSAGGLAAAFVGLRRPEIFGNVLSQSGAFGWSREPATAPAWSYEIPPPDSWLIEQYATTERLPLRFYLDAGLFEDHRDAAKTPILRANRHLHNVLRAKGYWVHYAEHCGGHQYINWRGALPDGLMALIGTAASAS
ncbi:MAG: enterochelin esterase [Chloroflexales bacterium]|nr:enterochelin esterase [Chloroflexales bacterium]